MRSKIVRQGYLTNLDRQYNQMSACTHVVLGTAISRYVVAKRVSVLKCGYPNIVYNICLLEMNVK